MRNTMTFSQRGLIAAAFLAVLTIGAVIAQMKSAPALASGSSGSTPLNTVVSVNHTTSATSTVQLPPLLPWSAVAATGSVDEDSLADYAFTQPQATYRAASQSLNPLVFRYNVTNPGHDSPIPGWTRLFLSSHVTAAASSVEATLFKVNPCTGEQTPICSTINDKLTDTPICTSCEFAANNIDLTQFVYYVRVTLNRADQPNPPSAYSVHLRP
jgi:hypothetical protein